MPRTPGSRTHRGIAFCRPLRGLGDCPEICIAKSLIFVLGVREISSKHQGMATVAVDSPSFHLECEANRVRASRCPGSPVVTMLCGRLCCSPHLTTRQFKLKGQEKPMINQYPVSGTIQRFLRGAVVASLLIMMSGTALAQGTPQKDDNPLKDVTITEVFTATPKASGEAAKAGINDSIRVRLEKLAEAKGVDKNKLVLFLGGLQIKGLYGQGVDTDSNVLEYKLTRDGSSSDAKAAWTNLLGSPTAYSKPVTVSIGIENGRPVAPTDPEHPPMFTLIILHRG